MPIDNVANIVCKQCLGVIPSGKTELHSCKRSVLHRIPHECNFAYRVFTDTDGRKYGVCLCGTAKRFSMMGAVDKPH